MTIGFGGTLLRPRKVTRLERTVHSGRSVTLLGWLNLRLESIFNLEDCYNLHTTAMSDNEDELNSSLTSIDWLSKMTSKDLKVNDHKNTLGDPPESDHIPDFKLIDEDSEGRCESSMFDSDDPKSKPRHSYATLIRQAIENSENQRATLSEIYKWITERYPFFRNTSSGWKNSIRHNLSLSKCFLKVPRDGNNPGKGCYWAIKHNPDDSLASNDNNSINYNTGKPRTKKSRVNDTHAGLTPPTIVNPLQIQRSKSNNQQSLNLLNHRPKLTHADSAPSTFFLTPSEPSVHLPTLLQQIQNQQQIFNINMATKLASLNQAQFSLPQPINFSTNYLNLGGNHSLFVPTPQPNQVTTNAVTLDWNSYLTQYKARTTPTTSLAPNDQLKAALQMAGIDPSSFESASPERVSQGSGGISPGYQSRQEVRSPSVGNFLPGLQPIDMPHLDTGRNFEDMGQSLPTNLSQTAELQLSATPSPVVHKDDISCPATPPTPTGPTGHVMSKANDNGLLTHVSLGDDDLSSMSPLGPPIDETSPSNCVNPADIFNEQSNSLNFGESNNMMSYTRRRSSTKSIKLETIVPEGLDLDDELGFNWDSVM